MDTLGNRIKTMRLSRGMTQVDLAGALDVSRSAVAMWEKDEREPNLETIEAIADVFNVSMSSLVERKADDAPLPYGLLRIKTKKIPLLGTIAAGVPVYAPDDYDAYVMADNGLKADFALRVHGDSMAPNFREKDIVFVRNQPDVYDGQVAAVSVDDEATLKYVYHVPGGLQLTSANQAYAPMLFTEENSDNLRI